MSAIVAAVTTAEIAAFAAQAIAAANAAALAASTAAATTTLAAVPTIATTLPTAFGAAGSSLGATGTGLTVGSGLGATGVGGAGLGTTGLTVGSGLGGMGGAGLGATGSAAAGGFGTGAAGLGTLGTMALPAAGGIGGTLAATVAPVVAEEGIKKLGQKGFKAAATEGGEGISKEALNKGNKQILLEASGKPPVPVEKPLPSDYFTRMADSSGSGRIMTDAPPVNAGTMKPSANPLPQTSPRNYGTSVRSADMGKAPTSPLKTFDTAVKTELSPRNMSGGVGGVDESLNAAAQRQASADTFGGVGTPYESAITKTPVEKSFLDKTLDKAGDFVMNNKMELALGGLGLAQMMPPSSGVNPISETMIRPYTYSEEDTSDQEADPSGREKIRYSSSYAAGTPYKAAQGGLLSLHRGGNFLSGRGDGMSDDIPAMIGTKQPARLADGEFVIPADVVSHIGNGSSKAGAEKLYAMMDKIRQERTGRKRQSPQINAAKYLPR